MHTRPFAWRAIVAVGIVLLLATDVAANGAYFPEQAFPAMPQIPIQRALIVWRDGTETLVVESSLNSDSPNVGWVLPLPAEPTKLETADPGMLTSLAMSQRASITHDLYPVVKSLVILLSVFVPVAALVIFRKDSRVRRRELGLLVVVYLVILFAFGLMMGTLGGHPASDTLEQGVQISSQQRVGNYKVSVLRAKSSDVLSEWLKAGSLMPLNEKARSIVDRYISEGWCFVVARLVRNTGGAATPHPIAVTFPAGKPIYPMRLTALAGSTTRVELFVAADRQAEADGFRVAAADRYRSVAANERSDPSYYEGVATGLIIGSPEVGEFLWQGCIVTRLTADLPAQAMDKDVTIALTDLAAHRDHFYSARARREIVWTVLLCAGIVLVVACAWLFRAMRRPERRKIMWLSGVALSALIAAAAVYVLLPVVPVQTGSWGHHSWRLQNRNVALFFGLKRLVGQGKLPAEMTPERWAEFPGILLEEGYLEEESILVNPFTGQRMKYERSPGNFSSRKVEGQTWLCFYDINGRETRFELKPWLGASPGEP